MISRSYTQFAIVAADSAQTLTEQLNAELLRLKDKNPTVTFEGMIARIQYTEREEVPESLAEEYEAQGVRLQCQELSVRIRKGDDPLGHQKFFIFGIQIVFFKLPHFKGAVAILQVETPQRKNCFFVVT